ncbi:hypothetical protein Trichorick_01276 [Candidatus Trichorickettsia mobilis]|jgi:hypothetical protein|uniref:Uncharacterized protein n=1 Tax=Candidatus Trichorickettsia mobilis TaxID=1346319 RepID=A0ABZ0UTK0_9RICK|nr:hypothetical protein [Candidatus Trichorickettsia mobilis]WPY01365.1 hypothetical protein Trichorick_01276 [Candidatus Trichorickettsia mobilis]
MGIPDRIQLTGNVYIKYIDEIIKPKIGDIMLLLNDDAISGVVGDYENMSVSGYIKAKVYDGRVWQNVNIAEFCTAREHKFAKKQRAIESAELCREIIAKHRNTLLEKTYRGHFTITW